MPLKARILEDMKSSLKTGDKTRLSVLRMLKARILEAEVERRAEKGRDYELGDEETTDVIVQYAKQRRQSIDSYQQAGRRDLAEKEEAELAVLHDYLPRPLSEEEVRTLVREAISATGARGSGNMGEVMKAVMPRLKGAADGKTVSAIVKQELASLEG